MRFLVGLTVFAGLFLLSFSAPASAQTNRSVRALENVYLSQLDRWVGEGGPIDGLQNEVVATCGKLVMLMASPGLRSAFVSTDPEEYDLRVDVCTKMTMHRVRAQPQLLQPGVVDLLCDRGNILFSRLCERSGLR